MLFGGDDLFFELESGTKARDRERRDCENNDDENGGSRRSLEEIEVELG